MNVDHREALFRSGAIPISPSNVRQPGPVGPSSRPLRLLSLFGRGREASGSGSLAYPAVRPQIQTGDVLLFRGRGPLSQFIRWGSGSSYSHAGFAARWGDRVLVFQATGLGGAAFLPLSAAVDAYDGAVDWYVPRASARARLDSTRLVTEAVSLLGRRYARGQVLSLMVRVARRKLGHVPDQGDVPHALFCSQYVSYCYRRAGHDLVPHLPDEWTSPADLAGSPSLELVGPLKADPSDKERRRIELPGRPRVSLK
jgi:hypothetical protein